MGKNKGNENFKPSPFCQGKEIHPNIITKDGKYFLIQYLPSGASAVIREFDDEQLNEYLKKRNEQK